MDLSQLQSALNKVLTHLDGEFATFQLGRANTSLVDSIEVFIPSRWMKQKMSQTANVSILDAQTLKIEPRDKTILSSVEKAVYDANIWLTPVNMGDHLMIRIPPLTTDRRKELTKFVAKLGEDAKISCRNARQDAMKYVKQAFDTKIISEDQKKSQEKTIEDLIKDYITKIDQKIKHKSEEIMTV